jgi:hypothetical protein
MAIENGLLKRILTLNSITPQTGSTFLVEYSTDCVNYYTASFLNNVLYPNIVAAGNISGIYYTSSLYDWNDYLNTVTFASASNTASILIPTGSNCIRLTNLVEPCVGTQYVEIIGTSTTTSTTTTTAVVNPCRCYEVVFGSGGGEINYNDCDGNTFNYVSTGASTYYQCVQVIGGLAQIFVVSGAVTLSIVGNCLTGPCPPTTTTTTTSTSTSTTTTTPPCVINTTINVTDTGWIRWTLCDDTIQDTFLSSLGTYTITQCIKYNSIRDAIPLADLATWNNVVWGSACTTTTTTTSTTTTAAPSATLAWSYSETGGANGEMRIYVNGSVVETRTNTSSGNYTGLVAGDTIYVQIELLSSCSSPDNKGNVYTSGNRLTLVDADCFTSSTGTLTTPTYTVVSGDIGTTITLNTFANCDSGCI